MAEEQEGVVTPEQNDADFESGFIGTKVKATETPAVTQDANAGAEQPAVSQEQSNVEQTAAEPETVQITKDQFERLTRAADTIESLNKRQDQVFGKLGAFEQRLATLQAETPTGQAVEVAEEDFEDLAKEFPDLAALQIKGLNKVLGKMRGTGGQSVDPKQIESAFQERITQAVGAQRAEMIEEVLADRHPDWKDLRDQKPVDYQEWLQSLPDQDRALYMNSSSPFYVAKRLDDFKTFRAKRAAPKAGSPGAATRKEMIQAAVTPRGTGGQPPSKTGDDDFESGFNKYAPG